jgi:hypothetical protein
MKVMVDCDDNGEVVIWQKNAFVDVQVTGLLAIETNPMFSTSCSSALELTWIHTLTEL